MNIAIEKKEIIKWINSLENPVVIEQIISIKKRDTESFDFDKEWEKGIPIKEARKKSSDFIKSLPWKK
ncbi:MAG: hypothetical protein WDZ45_11715 [Flavobacteriaceae bacterium]